MSYTNLFKFKFRHYVAFSIGPIYISSWLRITCKTMKCHTVTGFVFFFKLNWIGLRPRKRNNKSAKRGFYLFSMSARQANSTPRKVTPTPLDCWNRFQTVHKFYLISGSSWNMRPNSIRLIKLFESWGGTFNDHNDNYILDGIAYSKIKAVYFCIIFLIGRSFNSKQVLSTFFTYH